MSSNNLSDVYLAPMAGAADAVFRNICREYGKITVFTEMISSKAMYYDDKKTALLFPKKSEGKIPVQIFGHEPEIMALAAKKLEGTASEININMGCPMPKIFNNGDGSALMKNPALAAKIVCAVKSSVKIPVTVKIRKGISDEICVSFAKALENAGADKLYVHGRTREQLYSGKADIDAIKEVKKALSVPVIGNGDIFTAEDAVFMQEYTGCDGVMVGRGALGNPFIFREIEALKRGVQLPPADKEERVRVCIRHLADSVAENGEARGILESRKHMAWYLKTIPGASHIRSLLFTKTDINSILELLNSLI